MTMTERSTIVGVFPTGAQAEQAIAELHKIGLTDNQIGYAVRDTIGTTQGEITPADTDIHGGHHAAAGAIGGGVIGGVVGAAASLLIPGIGPAIAGGILIATIGGVAIGAAAGGLIGALTELGVPEEEARYYQNEFEAGRTIVTVNAPGIERQQDILVILRRNGAYDANTQQEYVDIPDTQQSYNQNTQAPANTTNEPAAQPHNFNEQANYNLATGGESLQPPSSLNRQANYDPTTGEPIQPPDEAIARQGYERPNN